MYDTFGDSEAGVFEQITINEQSGVPVWLQLRDRLLFLIKSHQLSPGDTLPTVRELAAQVGVNYNTVHKAYQDLQADGYISSQRGRKSYVTDKVPVEDAPETVEVDGLIDALVTLAREHGMSDRELLMRVRGRLAQEDETSGGN